MNNGLMVRMELSLQLLKMDDWQLFRLHNLIEEYAPGNAVKRRATVKAGSLNFAKKKHLEI